MIRLTQGVDRSWGLIIRDEKIHSVSTTKERQWMQARSWGGS
jgi:hypothetical protein